MLHVTDPRKHTVFRDKYEYVMQSLFDPFMDLHPSRPGSPKYSPYLNFDEAEYEYDPFGYYSKNKLIVDMDDAEYSLVEEYPLNANIWSYEMRPEMKIKSALPTVEIDIKQRLDEVHMIPENSHQ